MKQISAVVLCLSSVMAPTASFAFSFQLPSFLMDKNALKKEILQLSRDTQRGVTATAEQEKQMATLFRKLETCNPTPSPLKSSKVNGIWSLEYTTSAAINGKGDAFFPRVGPILQTIDTAKLSAENSETVSVLGLLPVPRKVTAALTPQNNHLTAVQFQQFQIGPVSFKAPETFTGSLDITYVDDDLRLTRGDKGNIFVLTRT